MGRTAWLLVALSLLFGLGYPLLWDQLPAPAEIMVKGAGVGLLALAAAWSARGPDGWLLAAVLGLGATGDVLLEIELAAGAAAFAAAHFVAIALYLRNPRPDRVPRDLGFAIMLPVVAVLIPLAMLDGRPEAWPFVLYALLLGTMAGSALLSRFPRLVPLGALLFLASDMLIAVRMADGEAWLGLPIWLLYYLGQLMIFLGVKSSLPPRGRSPGGAGTSEAGGGVTWRRRMAQPPNPGIPVRVTPPPCFAWSPSPSRDGEANQASSPSWLSGRVSGPVPSSS